MLFREDGFELFTALVEEVGDDTAKTLKKGIICDALVLRECFLSARHSITFHGQGTEANHLKQAGHLCFWMSKLKPLDLTTGAGEFAAELITGRTTFLGTKSVTLKPSMAQAMKHSDKITVVFPINEYCGLLIGHTMAIKGLGLLSRQSAEAGDHIKAKHIDADIKYHTARYMRTAHRIVKSLRTNNYSARSAATMFEWAYERPAFSDEA